MRYYCQHRDRDEERCKRNALAVREYCRWHLIPRQFRDYGKSWGGFWGQFNLVFAALCVLQVLIWFYRFLVTAELETLLLASLFIVVGSTCLGYGMMMQGSPRIIWPELYAISLGALCLFLISFAIAGGIKSAWAESVLKQFYPETTISHSLLLVSTFAIAGAYGMLYFISTVMFIRVPSRVYHLAMVAYLLALVVLAILAMAPPWLMFVMVLYIAYLLDIKYHWLNKIRDSLRF